MTTRQAASEPKPADGPNETPKRCCVAIYSTSTACGLGWNVNKVVPRAVETSPAATTTSPDQVLPLAANHDHNLSLDKTVNGMTAALIHLEIVGAIEHASSGSVAESTGSTAAAEGQQRQPQQNAADGITPTPARPAGIARTEQDPSGAVPPPASTSAPAGPSSESTKKPGDELKEGDKEEPSSEELETNGKSARQAAAEAFLKLYGGSPSGPTSTTPSTTAPPATTVTTPAPASSSATPKPSDRLLEDFAPFWDFEAEPPTSTSLPQVRSEYASRSSSPPQPSQVPPLIQLFDPSAISSSQANRTVTPLNYTQPFLGFPFLTAPPSLSAPLQRAGWKEIQMAKSVCSPFASTLAFTGAGTHEPESPGRVLGDFGSFRFRPTTTNLKDCNTFKPLQRENMSTPSSTAGTPSASKALSPSSSSAALPGSPAPASTPGAVTPKTSSTSTAPAKPKPVNVFSNDGSFLERMQRSKKAEDEKKKQDEVLARKRAFDDRFKSRGKRKTTSETNDSAESAAPPAKKAKELTQYEKEVKAYEGRSLKDQGIGIRPLVK
ncbi:hypothetical protein FRC05_009745 [Tulasnella sp. 425]|nr:hypothetical protein FRC05_009745 [Tulasnella sp. 425]